MSCVAVRLKEGSFLMRVRDRLSPHREARDPPDNRGREPDAAADSKRKVWRRARNKQVRRRTNHAIAISDDDDADADESSNGCESDVTRSHTTVRVSAKERHRRSGVGGPKGRCNSASYIENTDQDHSSSIHRTRRNVKEQGDEEEDADSASNDTSYSDSSSTTSDSDEEHNHSRRKARQKDKRKDKQERKWERERERTKVKEEKRRQQVEKLKLKQVEKQRKWEKLDAERKRKQLEKEQKRLQQQEEKDKLDLQRLDRLINKIKEKEDKLEFKKQIKQQMRQEKLAEQQLIRDRMNAQQLNRGSIDPNPGPMSLPSSYAPEVIPSEDDSVQEASRLAVATETEFRTLDSSDEQDVKSEDHPLDYDDGNELEKAKEEVPDASQEESTSICWLPSTTEIRVTVEEAKRFDRTREGEGRTSPAECSLRSAHSHAGVINRATSPRGTVMRERSSSVRMLSSKQTSVATPAQLIKGLVAFDELEEALYELNRQVDELRALAQR